MDAVQKALLLRDQLQWEEITGKNSFSRTVRIGPKILLSNRTVTKKMGGIKASSLTVLENNENQGYILP